jgi:hypothetical protein
MARPSSIAGVSDSPPPVRRASYRNAREERSNALRDFFGVLAPRREEETVALVHLGELDRQEGRTLFDEFPLLLFIERTGQAPDAPDNLLTR